jgi:ParB/RepB/Spo0J family partition protein
MKKTTGPESKEIPLNMIDQPIEMARKKIDQEYITELSESIKAQGLLQAILVRPKGSRFEIIAGHCRYLATEKLGKETIRCDVAVMDDTSTVMARATENLARSDITPIEEGTIYKSLIEKHGVKIETVAKRMGISTGLVKRRMDLLKMPPQLQKAIHEKKISYSVAEELWSLGEEGAIDYYLGFCVDHGATAGVVRQWVYEWKADKRRKETGDGGSRDPLSPMESRPVYVACDTCEAPMKLGDETVIRCCEVCCKAIAVGLGK